MIQIAHRIVLTELCNGTCPHCFNASFRKTAEMNVDTLIKFWKKNQSALLYGKRLKIMGGEPTLHPRILEVMQDGCIYFGGVDLFTNGTNMVKITKDPLILKYHLMGNIEYIINGFTFELEKFKDYAPYIRKLCLHFVVPFDKKELHEMISKVFACIDTLQTFAHIIISPDTQVNLFDDGTQEIYRERWMEAITTIVPNLIERGTNFNYDHVLPMCFYTQEMLDILHKIPIHDNNSLVDGIHSLKITCCGDVQMGLILPNFDLYFCNQTRIKIGSLLDENGEPKYLHDIMRMIQPFSKIKTESVKNLLPKCKICPVVSSCKTGCYYTTLLRSSKNELP
jgi:radical SAM protein with 4Fe4S-binding SPASM domain